MAEIDVRKSGDVAGAIERLPVEQRTALESMLMGKSVAETARLMGVGRSTIYHWLRNDPVFQAAYNQWHDEMQESCRSRLMMMTDKAATALEKALDAGDARSALQLLKGMGLIGEKPVGTTDAEEIKLETATRKKTRRAKLYSDDVMAGFGV